MREAERIVRALGGRWSGRGGVVCCPAHEDRAPSLSVTEGRDGRLLLRCFAGCDFEAVAAALRSRGLLEGLRRDFAPDPEAAARRRAEAERDAARRTAQARRLWQESRPIGGTLAESYLRARAIRGPLPGSLRYHASAWHGPSARRLPAMVAAVTLEGEAEPVAVHRTYLAEPGRKADVAPNRAMLGPCAGFAVVLSEGPGPLLVAEGVETALSLRDALTDLSPRVWAALSTSGVSGLRLPDRPGELIAAPDGDAPGMAAAEALAARAHAAGWNVKILPPPGAGRDWNDVAARAATQDEGKAA